MQWVWQITGQAAKTTCRTAGHPPNQWLGKRSALWKGSARCKYGPVADFSEWKGRNTATSCGRNKFDWNLRQVCLLKFTLKFRLRLVISKTLHGWQKMLSRTNNEPPLSVPATGSPWLWLFPLWPRWSSQTLWFLLKKGLTYLWWHPSNLRTVSFCAQQLVQLANTSKQRRPKPRGTLIAQLCGNPGVTQVSLRKGTQGDHQVHLTMHCAGLNLLLVSQFIFQDTALDLYTYTPVKT